MHLIIISLLLAHIAAAAYIGLSSTEFHIDEMVEGLQHFPIIRNGSINQTNRVLCKLKPINTTAQIVNFLEADFVVPSKPETITFQPFDTIQSNFFPKIF